MNEAPAQRDVAPAIDLGQALGSLLRRYLEGSREAVRDLPGGPRGFQVLSIAANGACSNQARIAEQLGLDRTVMTYLVDDLEQAGLAERRPDPADRRARRVAVTAKGEKVLAACAAQVAEVEQAVLGALSADEAAVLRRLLISAAADASADHSLCDGESVPDC